jgi:CubicO group peptidase (beta-lactamase class C family)
MTAKTSAESRDRWLARLLGADFLLWSPNIQAEGFLHWDRIFASRPIRRGSHICELARADQEIDVLFEDQGRRCDVNDLMRDEHLSGLIVLRKSEILLERYALGLTPELRWQSSSMVKSLTSTLIGAALYENLIGSLDDEMTHYLP